MPFFMLIFRNLLRQRVRTLLTAFGISLGITTVVALGVVTDSLKATAQDILTAGGSDFAIAQSGSADITYSTVTDEQLRAVAAYEGVEHATGVLLAVSRLGSNPYFIQMGIDPSDLAVLSGAAAGRAPPGPRRAERDPPGPGGRQPARQEGRRHRRAQGPPLPGGGHLPHRQHLRGRRRHAAPGHGTGVRAQAGPDDPHLRQGQAGRRPGRAHGPDRGGPPGAGHPAHSLRLRRRRPGAPAHGRRQHWPSPSWPSSSAASVS